MMNKLKILLLVLWCFAAYCGAMSAQTVGEATTPTDEAKLTNIKLSGGARRIKNGMSPAEIKEVLAKLVEQGGPIVRQGESEVLLWSGDYRNANGERTIKLLQRDLRQAGWEYEVGAVEKGITIFTLFRATPSRRALVGFFAPSDQAFIFAVSEMLPNITSGTNEPAEKSDKNSNASLNKTDKHQADSSDGDASPQLTGKWFRSIKKDISGLSGYTDATFEFYADGTMKSTVENQSLDAKMCSITENSAISGAYTIAGNQLTMNLKPGTLTGKSSCGESGNFKKNLSASTLAKTFVIKPMESPFRPDSPALLCLDGAADKQCFERVPY